MIGEMEKKYKFLDTESIVTFLKNPKFQHAFGPEIDKLIEQRKFPGLAATHDEDVDKLLRRKLVLFLAEKEDLQSGLQAFDNHFK